MAMPRMIHIYRSINNQIVIKIILPFWITKLFEGSNKDVAKINDRRTQVGI